MPYYEVTVPGHADLVFDVEASSKKEAINKIFEGLDYIPPEEFPDEVDNKLWGKNSGIGYIALYHKNFFRSNKISIKLSDSQEE